MTSIFHDYSDEESEEGEAEKTKDQVPSDLRKSVSKDDDSKEKDMDFYDKPMDQESTD